MIPRLSWLSFLSHDGYVSPYQSKSTKINREIVSAISIPRTHKMLPDDFHAKKKRNTKRRERTFLFPSCKQASSSRSERRKERKKIIA